MIYICTVPQITLKECIESFGCLGKMLKQCAEKCAALRLKCIEKCECVFGSGLGGEFEKEDPSEGKLVQTYLIVKAILY